MSSWGFHTHIEAESGNSARISPGMMSPLARMPLPVSLKLAISHFFDLTPEREEGLGFGKLGLSLSLREVRREAC